MCCDIVHVFGGVVSDDGRIDVRRGANNNTTCLCALHAFPTNASFPVNSHAGLALGGELITTPHVCVHCTRSLPMPLFLLTVMQAWRLEGS